MHNVNIHPIAPDVGRRVTIAHATANTARDGSGTITALLTAGLRGSVIPAITVRSQAAAGANTPMVVRLWHRIAGAGTWFLLDEVALTAVTSSNTAVGASATFPMTNIMLTGQAPGSASGADTLGITITISESVSISCGIGDY